MTRQKSSLFEPARWTASVWVPVLILLSLLTFLPGFFAIPPIDRDETRFAQASRQMVQSGDYVDIRFHDGNRYKKPIGIYWLQAISVHAVQPLLEEEAPIWVYRIPSLVGALLAVVLTFWVALAFLPASYAALGALMMMASILLGVEARIAKTDAFLLATILVAQGWLARAWMQRQALPNFGFFCFWGAMGFGILLKGPIVLMVSGLTLLSLMIVDRSFQLLKALRPLPGLLLMLAVAVPWFVAIGLKSNGAFFIEAGLVDFLAKVTNVKESHGGPPGIYAAILVATFWPSSLVLFSAIPILWKNRKEKAVLFALCWALPSWLVFELTSTKLPHYVLPLYPALALLIAVAFAKNLYASAIWQRLVTALWIVFPAALGIAAFGGLIYLENVVDPFVLLAVGLSTGLGFIAWRLFAVPERAKASLVFVVASAITLYIALYEFAFPKIQTIWVSDRVVAMLQKHGIPQECAEPRIVSVGYNEPSLAFLAPLDLRFKNIEEAIDLLKENSCRSLLVVGYLDAELQGAATQANLPLTAVDSLSGFKLNGGDAITITLYEAAASADTHSEEGGIE